MNLKQALKYTSDNRTHADFVDAALANPTQDIHPLAYADWLQEQGQEGLAVQVRSAVDYAKGLSGAVNLQTGTNIPQHPTVDIHTKKGWKNVDLFTRHPSSSPHNGAMFFSSHSPEEALSLLRRMEGVAGQQEALEFLKQRQPHLFPAEQEKEIDAQTDRKQYRGE